MAQIKLNTYASLMSSLNEVKAAASHVGESTHTHAQEHVARLDALRREQEHKRAIDDGIARATGTV